MSNFSNVDAKNSKDFVTKCWRRILTDNAAKSFSWQGTLEKKAIRAIATTSAIRRKSKIFEFLAIVLD